MLGFTHTPTGKQATTPTYPSVKFFFQIGRISHTQKRKGNKKPLRFCVRFNFYFLSFIFQHLHIGNRLLPLFLGQGSYVHR